MLPGMEANLVTNLFLPLALAVIMFGLGLHLHTADFMRVVQMPRTVLIGLGVQLLVLPPIAFLLCLLFALPPLLAVGLMLLVASPGGATANVFSHLARGDVALNITLTAINSLLILITLPLVVQCSMAYFLGDQALIPAPVQKIAEVASIILLPVALGMWLRRSWSRLADRLERVVRPMSLLILALLIALTAHKEWALLRANWLHIGGVCLLLNLASLGIGYATARLASLPARQAIAIAFEIGIHNSALAIFIALNVLQQPATSIPAATYSLLMYLTAGLAAWWFRRAHPSPKRQFAPSQ